MEREHASAYQDWEQISLPSRSPEKTIASPPVSPDLSKQTWFLPTATREVAEDLLKRTGTIGSFVVRPSTSNKCFAISFVTEKKEIKHQLIYHYPGGFSFKESITPNDTIYPTVPTLLSHCSALGKLKSLSQIPEESRGNHSFSLQVPNANRLATSGHIPRSPTNASLKKDEEMAFRLAQQEAENGFPVRTSNLSSPQRGKPRVLARSFGNTEEETFDLLLSYKDKTHILPVEGNYHRTTAQITESDSDDDGVEIVDSPPNRSIYPDPLLGYK